MASLVITDGPAGGQRYDLTRRLILIGRDDACTIQIPDRRVSRRHLQIGYDRSGKRHFAVDVGSANGVMVNDTRLQRGSQHVLNDGDVIRIGLTHLRYTRNPDTATEA